MSEERTDELTVAQAKAIADTLLGATDKEVNAQVNAKALADFVLRGA